MMPAIRRVLITILALCGVVAPALAADATLAVHEAWARATPPGTSVAAVYLRIAGGGQADRLLKATTARAGMTQIHRITETEGMSRMRPVESVDIPAHETVSFDPRGLHLMLMNLARPLVAGERFPVTLTFAQAGPVEVEVTVLSPDESAPPGH
jgi:copper(I)-binding protein